MTFVKLDTAYYCLQLRLHNNRTFEVAQRFNIISFFQVRLVSCIASYMIQIIYVFKIGSIVIDC